MDCIPPWLSSEHQCKTNITTYNYTKEEIKSMILKNFIAPKYDSRLIKAEETCKNPCMKMTNILSMRANQNRSEYTDLYTGLEFRFQKTAKLERKILSYTGFNFIIDVGSSLGLWLGLSALGITDIALKAIMVAKRWSEVKLLQLEQ